MTAPPRTPHRYLILGGGAVVAELHLPALAALGWLDAIQVADPSAAAVQRIASAFPAVAVVATDYRAALDAAPGAGIDAVIVALPNALHEDAVARALELGLDVLCEKPLTLTQAGCERLAAQAETRGRLLAVGMVRRFMPSIQALRAVLAAGWIGDVTSADVQWGGAFAWPSDSGHYFKAENAGVLANLGVHSLDTLEYVLGPLQPVRYRDDWGRGAEANARFDLRTGTGAAVSLTLSYTHQLPDETRVRGSRGEAWFDQNGATVHLRTAVPPIDADATSPRPFAHGTWPPTLASCFLEQFADFDAAITSRRSPAATGRDAARTAALIDWAYAHHRPAVVERAARSTRLSLGPGRIVITGGTGFLGGHLVEALAADGQHELVLPVRSYRSGANAGRFPVEMVRADLLDPAALTAVMTGARHVFHLAYGRDGEDAARVTVEGTKNVVNAAVEAGVESVVVVSTTSLFGDPGGSGEADETFPYAPHSEYERLKAEAERWTLARAAHERNTRIVVVNPSCIYGPQGKAFTELPARLLKDRAFCWIEDGRGVVNYVYVQNLVDALLLAAVRPDAAGERFIVSDGATTWREFYTELFGDRVAGLPSHTRAELDAMAQSTAPGLRDLARALVASPELRRVIRENRGLARAKGLARQATPKLFNRLRATHASASLNGAAPAAAVHPPAWLADLFQVSGTRFSAAKARRVLGWSPIVDLHTGQTLSREWLTDVRLVDGAP